jgi:hypothetical protein
MERVAKIGAPTFRRTQLLQCLLAFQKFLRALTPLALLLVFVIRRQQ